jgi:phosphohistidine phosphatase
MKRLILFRHAKTERHAPSGEDFDRRLTERGVEDARLIGRALADEGISLDLALVSSAARARETWEAIQPIFPDVEAEVRPELYNSDARDILRIAKRAEAETVMVVAHNPGMHVLAASLVDQSGDGALALKIQDGLPTGGVGVFDIDGDAVEARGLFFPRDYGGGSRHD